MSSSETEHTKDNYIVYLSAPDVCNPPELNSQITDMWNRIVLAAHPVATGKTKGLRNEHLQLEDGNTALSIWEKHSELLTATFNDDFTARNVAFKLRENATPKFLNVTIALVGNNTPGRIIR